MSSRRFVPAHRAGASFLTMQLVRIVVLALVLVACGSPPKPAKPGASEPAPVDDFFRGCTCERLNAAVQIPSPPVELARWERVAAELRTLERAIVDLFPAKVKCTAAINDQLAQLFSTHANAISESRALNDATCAHFARWRFERTDKRLSETILSAMRGECLLLERASLDVLNALSITRGCTTVSGDRERMDDERRGSDERHHERSDRDGVNDHAQRPVTHQRDAICAASAATATDDKTDDRARSATNAANRKSRAALALTTSDGGRCRSARAIFS
jgi:hypothetical protein